MGEEQEFVYSDRLSKRLSELLLLAPVSNNLTDGYQWIMRNAIPIFSFNEDSIVDIPNSKYWKKMIRFSRNKMRPEKKSWIHEFKSTSQMLEDNGIDICLTKTYGPFPQWSGNIDAIVRESDFSETIDLLKEFGFIRLGWLDEPHKILLKKFKDGKSTISLHMHSRIAWNATYIHDAAAMKNSRSAKEFGPWRIIGRDALTSTILAHSLIENRNIRAIDLFIADELARDESSWKNGKEIAKEEGWLREFMLSNNAFILLANQISIDSNKSLFRNIAGLELTNDALNGILFDRRQCLSLPRQLPLWLTKGFLARRLLLRDENRNISEGMSKISALIQNYLIRKLKGQRIKGKIIAISGPDGSGKSTMAQLISNVFQEFGIESKIFWSRYGTPPLIIHRAFSNNNEPSIKKADLMIHFKRNGVKPKLRMIENMLKLSVCSLNSKFFGANMLFDRHLLDSEVDYSMDSSGKRKFLLKIGKAIVPHPDFHIFLMASAEKLSLRSNEPLSRIRDEIRIYDDIIRQGYYSIVKIESNREAERLIDQIIPQIAGKIYDTGKKA